MYTLEWDHKFYSRSLIFENLKLHFESFTTVYPTDWPGLTDYQRCFTEHATTTINANNQSLKFVRQTSASTQFYHGYEPRIYLKGEIQTREKNWHDFFQVLIWSLYPKTKAQLNQLHFKAASNRITAPNTSKNRSQLENMITLLDECGVILLSSSKYILETIRDFKWKELFISNRELIAQELQCIVFGHALYEKALSQYIGMTGQAILFYVEPEFLKQPHAVLSEVLDTSFANFLNDLPEQYLNPSSLTPFPILGMPDWDSNNKHECYYENTQYFRSGRTKAKAPIFTLNTN